jgi:hypothetical protein
MDFESVWKRSPIRLTTFENPTTSSRWTTQSCPRRSCGRRSPSPSLASCRLRCPSSLCQRRPVCCRHSILISTIVQHGVQHKKFELTQGSGSNSSSSTSLSPFPWTSLALILLLDPPRLLIRPHALRKGVAQFLIFCRGCLSGLFATPRGSPSYDGQEIPERDRAVSTRGDVGATAVSGMPSSSPGPAPAGLRKRAVTNITTEATSDAAIARGGERTQPGPILTQSTSTASQLPQTWLWLCACAGACVCVRIREHIPSYHPLVLARSGGLPARATWRLDRR